MPTTNLSIRIDIDKKKEAEELFRNLGLSLTTAFNIFITQSLRVRGIPFAITEEIPNAETLEAIKEARRIARDPNVKGYDVEEALKKIKS
ncbi:MAG: type II toxin-antitoxin system RelB/DinJ family antitoxin [Victivallales bacterium]|nr:type II toxin-antitoxin system RelB/DinJ family antitoxin [Victivallales bacterium]